MMNLNIYCIQILKYGNGFRDWFRMISQTVIVHLEKHMAI